jgi:hypothetical protein
MTTEIYLFDMDGVLLEPRGYHESLRTSVKRIGAALGAPHTDLADNQIAKFEALTVTNEWDTLAICTALILLDIWRVDGKVRLDGIAPNTIVILDQKTDFDEFLATFEDVGNLPGYSCYQKIINDNPWLNNNQRDYLQHILFNCRDIYQSPTLPIHQETVLGSQKFHETYDLNPKLDTQSYLLIHDRPIFNKNNQKIFSRWLGKSTNFAGILTNRPSSTPPGYLSSPEAELGAELVGLGDLPILGSGILAWYAKTQLGLPDYSLLKPNPVHTLALLQMCLGCSRNEALDKAVSLWREEAAIADWQALQRSAITIFEDSAKGLYSGIEARDLLKKIGIDCRLNLIGVTNNPIKRKALKNVSDSILPNINHFEWL